MSVKQILDIVMQDYLRKLYAFCLRETRNHADAEDLCQDILTEIVYSAGSMRNPGALPGWVWTIARRTQSRWVKRIERTEPLQDSIPAPYVCLANALCAAEQVQQLRREIGLLSRVHREVIVLHYLREKTCAEIAATMDISESMVKYHLVSARRKIKEGITLERERGTTSYALEEFDYGWWGDEAYLGEAAEWHRVLSRKLPKSLLRTAYSEPLTIQELSIETGVPVAFLEDEINILLRYEMLEESAGGRYKSNLCIIDKEAVAAIDAICASEAPLLAEELFAGMQECESAIRSIGFHRSDMDRVQYLWLAPIILNDLLIRRLESEVLPADPPLMTGGRAWQRMNAPGDGKGSMWGGGTFWPTDATKNRLLLRDLYPLNQRMDRPHNLGHYIPSRGDRGRAVDLMSTMTGSGLSVDGLSADDEAECATLIAEHFVENRNGRLLTRIPVFSIAQYAAFGDVLDTKMPFIENRLRKMHADAAEILRERFPKRFKRDAGPYAYLQLRGGFPGRVLEAMYDAGRMPIPERHAHAMIIVQAEPAIGGSRDGVWNLRS